MQERNPLTIEGNQNIELYLRGWISVKIKGEKYRHSKKNGSDDDENSDEEPEDVSDEDLH